MPDQDFRTYAEAAAAAQRSYAPKRANAKAAVLTAARQHGWTVDSDYVESAELSNGDARIFIQFTRRGERVSSAISYSPRFALRHRDRDKLGTLLAWLRGGWKEDRA